MATTAVPARYGSSSGTIASTSSHHQAPARPAGSSSHQSQSRPSPRYSPYTPELRDLHPGPKNRLLLSLRSTVPEEVDWALPRLVAASHDLAEQFRLETWVDSVGILIEYPNQWITHLEIEHQARNTLPWTRDSILEKRATNALLILRNASLLPSNAKIICRATFLSLLHRLFSLPQDFLLEVTMKYPEPFQHILVILQSIFPHIGGSQPVHHIFGRVLPGLFIQTRDLGMIDLLLPLLISGLTLPGALQPIEELSKHLLVMITLTPPGNTLDLLLDLLISLTQNANTARQILSHHTLAAHLRSLTMLLQHSSRPYTAQWDAAKMLVGVTVRNPAAAIAVSEEVSRRRGVEREKNQRLVSAGLEVMGELADKPPGLSTLLKTRLYALAEPARSVAWYVTSYTLSTGLIKGG
jgi:chromatin structure-remodeling complex subunit RSC9